MSHRVQRLAMALVLGCALAVCAGAGVAAAAGASPHARLTTHAAANSRAHRIVQHDSRTSRPYTTALNVAIVGTATGSSGWGGRGDGRRLDAVVCDAVDGQRDRRSGQRPHA